MWRSTASMDMSDVTLPPLAYSRPIPVSSLLNPPEPRPQPVSRFLPFPRLPLELRSVIWNMAVAGDTVLTLDHRRSRRSLVGADALPISQSCREARAELQRKRQLVALPSQGPNSRTHFLLDWETTVVVIDPSDDETAFHGIDTSGIRHVAVVTLFEPGFLGSLKGTLLAAPHLMSVTALVIWESHLKEIQEDDICWLKQATSPISPEEYHNSYRTADLRIADPHKVLRHARHPVPPEIWETLTAQDRRCGVRIISSIIPSMPKFSSFLDKIEPLMRASASPIEFVSSVLAQFGPTEDD